MPPKLQEPFVRNPLTTFLAGSALPLNSFGLLLYTEENPSSCLEVFFFNVFFFLLAHTFSDTPTSLCFEKLKLTELTLSQDSAEQDTGSQARD